jgi:hypothetical protein
MDYQKDVPAIDLVCVSLFFPFFVVNGWVPGVIAVGVFVLETLGQKLGLTVARCRSSSDK